MNSASFVLALLVIIFAYKIVIEAVRRQHDAGHGEETKILQDIHRSLSRLEERVEALETLVIDKTHADDFERRLSS